MERHFSLPKHHYFSGFDSTLPGEFFLQTSVDDGILFGFHRMNAFLGLQRLDGMHFHDVEKNVTPERIEKYISNYRKHLYRTFSIEDHAG